jgi:hypothetical protein
MNRDNCRKEKVEKLKNNQYPIINNQNPESISPEARPEKKQKNERQTE